MYDLSLSLLPNMNGIRKEKKEKHSPLHTQIWKKLSTQHRVHSRKKLTLTQDCEQVILSEMAFGYLSLNLDPKNPIILVISLNQST